MPFCRHYEMTSQDKLSLQRLSQSAVTTPPSSRMFFPFYSKFLDIVLIRRPILFVHNHEADMVTPYFLNLFAYKPRGTASVSFPASGPNDHHENLQLDSFRHLEIWNINLPRSPQLCLRKAQRNPNQIPEDYLELRSTYSRMHSTPPFRTTSR